MLNFEKSYKAGAAFSIHQVLDTDVLLRYLIAPIVHTVQHSDGVWLREL